MRRYQWSYCAIAREALQHRRRLLVQPVMKTTRPVKGWRMFPYANGFQGGAGGIVHLNSSLATVSRLRPNSWIMLSRSVLSGTVDVHRWYRVVGVDGRAEEVLATDPANAANQINTWRHKVLLDGPDWGFGFVGDADNTVEDNTVATLVDGVVSVTERTVLISDL